MTAAWRCIIGVALILFALGIYLGHQATTLTQPDHPVVQFDRAEP